MAFARLIALMLTGCATVSVRPELEMVKRVAIVAFIGELDLSANHPKLGRGQARRSLNATNSIFALASGALKERRTTQATGCYDLLASKLKKRLGWQVLDRTTLIAHPRYSTLYSKRDRAMLSGYGRLRIEGLLDVDEAAALSKEARTELKEALGVDALVTVSLVFRVAKLSGREKYGPSNPLKHPQASVALEVLGAGEMPLWRDTGALGPPSEKGIREASLADEALLQAAEHAFETLLDRLPRSVH